MEYFPLFIRIQGSPCLIAGGGTVALRKARLLLRADAAVVIVAPELHPQLAELADQGRIRHIAADFDSTTDVSGYVLLVAATDDGPANARVAAAAAAAGIPCNVVDDRELSTAIMPGIIDRSPLIVAVSSGGESPVMTTRVRQQIEKLLPTRLGALGDFAGKWRQAVKQRFADVPARRHFWQQIFDGRVAQLVLQNETEAAATAMQEELEAAQERSGFAWIVGAGPGDPELLTVKAARALAAADTILHDRLVAPAILDMARRDADFISVGKQAGQPSISQTSINELLVERVRAGETVCRLKGGDPFIFGRGGEELEALDAADLPWEVIPGITAASGCAAATGIPLTHRDVARAVTFVTASTAGEDDRDWSNYAHSQHTLVVYMAVRRLPDICAALIAAGKDPTHPAVIVENGTTQRQRLIRGSLANIAGRASAATIGSPAVLIVGEVADLARLTGAAISDADDGWAPAAMTGGS